MARRATGLAAIGLRIGFLRFFYRIGAVVELPQVFPVLCIRKIPAIAQVHFMVAVGLLVFVYIIAFHNGLF